MKYRSASEGEAHEHCGASSDDRSSTTLDLRQLHFEGLVNEFRLTASGASRLAFTTAAIVSISFGRRALEIHTKVSDDKLVETFPPAAPRQGLRTLL